MLRVRLIHWKADEARERAGILRAARYEVDQETMDGAAALRALGERLPAAIVIDLSRQPSHGRDVALAVRTRKATRRVPLVFVEGAAETVERIKALLPDAVYTTWPRIRGALKQAIASPPADPVTPRSNLEGYSGTPLPKKLGIRPGSVVGLFGAPPGFEAVLGELPEGAALRRRPRGRCDLALWFVGTLAGLRRGIPMMVRRGDEGGLWIAWPKKSSGMHADVSENDVRREGLAAGLVDFKICSIDATWSGLRFSRRRPGPRA
jgi:CheY-like chemotaxis protein